MRSGNEERPVESSEIVVFYRTNQGMAEKKFKVYRTQHGPIVRELNGNVAGGNDRRALLVPRARIFPLAVAAVRRYVWASPASKVWRAWLGDATRARGWCGLRIQNHGLQ